MDDVKNVMTQNIERVLDRGERLENLIDKTEELEASVSSAIFTTLLCFVEKFQDRFCFYEQSLCLIKNHSVSKVRLVFPMKFNFRVWKMIDTCYS